MIVFALSHHSLSPYCGYLWVTQVKIIGVEPADANSMALSLHHGERVILNQIGGFADGVAVKEVGEETFRICRKLIDGVVLVTRDAMCASIKVTCTFRLQSCIEADK